MGIFSRRFMIWGGVALVLVVVVVGIFLSRGNKQLPYEFATAVRSDLKEEVSVTGKVKPAESVDLAFEKGGRVARVRTQVGDKVEKGAVLVELDTTELQAQLAEAEAARAVQAAKLAEMELGTRPEEIALAQTDVESAQKSLADANLNLENVKAKAVADLDDDYDSALTEAQKAVNAGINSLLVLTDIQSAHFSGFDQQSVQVADAKAKAVEALLGAQGAGRTSKDYLSQLSGGAKGSVLIAQGVMSYANTDKAVVDAKAALSLVKAALDAVPVLSSFTSTEATNLSTEKGTMSTELVSIAAKQQAVEVQKAANQSSVATAEASVTSAQNALEAAQAELVLKQAGYTQEQILAQKASVQQQEARVQTISAQLSKSVLTSPIAGVVTKQDAKTGEIAPANTTVVSLISENDFEIEANVPEADIANVKVGDGAQVTLDAYGSDVTFETTVSKIDPGELILEGVATYKVTFQFLAKDDRLKSGMTANIDILTDERKNVIVVPQRAVVNKDGGKIVRMLKDGAVQEVPVSVGLRGSDGRIEIVSGVNEGDSVITFINE